MAVTHTTCQNKTLLHVLVTCRLDYCNALLLYGLIILSKDYNMLWTQRPKLSLESESLTSITMMTMIMLLHTYWTTLASRPLAYCFKILLYTFKALHGVTPTYLTELRSPSVPRRALGLLTNCCWSSQRPIKSIGLRAFSVCAPYLWNPPPYDILIQCICP